MQSSVSCWIGDPGIGAGVVALMLGTISTTVSLLFHESVFVVLIRSILMRHFQFVPIWKVQICQLMLKNEIIFLFISLNIYFGCSKEPSH